MATTKRRPPMNATNEQQLTDALKRARADVASLTDWIEMELEGQAELPSNWGTVGNLNAAKERLIEALEFISPASDAEIRRCLDDANA